MDCRTTIFFTLTLTVYVHCSSYFPQFSSKVVHFNLLYYLQLAATPSKRRLKTTTEYIYETLFKDGKDSDVVVKALGKSWNLHKVESSPHNLSV